MFSAANTLITDKLKLLYAQRTEENKHEIDPILVHLTWESYNQTKLEGTDPFSGISVGEFFTKTKLLSRTIIGYDYSPIAINHINNSKMLGRQVNLNEIDDESNQLAYHELLETDLSTAAEILIIRTLGCLTPEAVVLLIHTIINLAKSGSTIYIENWKPKEDDKQVIVINRNLPDKYIASFFAPRTDIEFKLSKIYENELADARSPESITERLIVRKR